MVKHPPPAWEPEDYDDLRSQNQADLMFAWNEEVERTLRAQIRDAIAKVESVSVGLTKDKGRGAMEAPDTNWKRVDGTGTPDNDSSSEGTTEAKTLLGRGRAWLTHLPLVSLTHGSFVETSKASVSA